MDIRVLLEARRNADVNYGGSVNDQLKPYMSKMVHGTDKVYVSFTVVDKIGINPSSEYETPIGVYTYPISYLSDVMGGSKSTTEVPFMGDAPYINVLETKVRVLDLDNVDEDDLNGYMRKLREYLTQYMEEGENPGAVMQSLYRQSELGNDAPYGEYLWDYTRLAKNWVAERTGKTRAVVWNAMFRAIGIQAIVDYGNGIIHPEEPTQAVFFSSRAFTLLERIRNRSSKGEIEALRSAPVGSVDEIVQWVKDNGLFGDKAKVIQNADAVLVLLRDPEYHEKMRNSMRSLRDGVQVRVVQKLTIDELKRDKFYGMLSEAALIAAIRAHGQEMFDVMLASHGVDNITNGIVDAARKMGLRVPGIASK